MKVPLNSFHLNGLTTDMKQKKYNPFSENDMLPLKRANFFPFGTYSDRIESLLQGAEKYHQKSEMYESQKDFVSALSCVTEAASEFYHFTRSSFFGYVGRTLSLFCPVPYPSPTPPLPSNPNGTPMYKKEMKR